MAKQNKPAIRFKGFTDAWEQRKLGEILQERNTRTSDFESNPLYSLTIESGVTPKTDRYERSSLVTKTEDLFKTVKPNEFVTNPMNLRFGALGYNKNAFTVSVSGYYDVFSIDDDKCSGFWNAYFKTPTAMNIFDNAATGSLIEKRRVKYSTLQQLAFYMPNDLSEKAEIGKYMDTFDNLITLHQRKYDKLQVLKKAMLEKMFPRNGSSVPEIRFKGFTDAWEQRKFDEVFDCTIPNNTLSRAELNYESGSVRNIHYGDILIKYGSVVDVQNDEIPFATGKSSDDFKGALLQDGDIIIADTAEDETTGKACEIGNSQGLDVVSGLHTMVCRPRNKMALGYLGYYLNSDAYHHQLLPLMQGIKVLSLSRTNVQKTMVCYPKSKAEQQLIADCFRNLDNLITLHQRELEKLQNIKKSMLEKMFV